MARALRAHFRSRHHGRGQGLVEFALVLPILMLILLITVDFGRIYMGWTTLNNAARIAANYAASGQPPLTPTQLGQYNTIVQNETAGINCDLPNPIPPPTYPGPAGTQVGGRAVASLTCGFHLITPFLGGVFPGGVITVGASADFPIRSGVLANINPGATPPSGVAPNQDFKLTPNTGPVPLTVNFSLLSQQGGAAQTWLWDFGDGTQDTSSIPPPHPYTNAGTYNVTLKETNTWGTSPNYSHSVVVDVSNPAPVASFYGEVPEALRHRGCPVVGVMRRGRRTTIYYTWNLLVDFTSTSQNTSNATYSWDFGDGSAKDTTANPSHSYTKPGSFNVKLTVTTADGTNTATKTRTSTPAASSPCFTGVSSGSAGGLWTGAHFTQRQPRATTTPTHEGRTTPTRPGAESCLHDQPAEPAGRCLLHRQDRRVELQLLDIGKSRADGANPLP